MNLSIDHHILIEITIFGMVVDVLGGLFLAYELLGGKKGPLRTVTRVITYGSLAISLSLVGVVVAFPLAIRFHFIILVTFGISGTFGLLLGYMIGWGFGVAVGYISTSSYVEPFKTDRPPQSPTKVGKFGILLKILGLMPLIAGTLINTSRSVKSIGRRTVLIIGCGLIAGFIIGYFVRKLIKPRIGEDFPQEQEAKNVKHVEGVTLKPSQIQTPQMSSTRNTQRFRIVAAFGGGFVMGFLFWLGGVIIIDFRLVHSFASGITVGIIVGLINGFVFGFLIRLYLIRVVDIDSPIQPTLDIFDILIGSVITFTTSFCYGFGIWLLFGGNLIVLLLVGSLVGFLGGFGGGILLCVAPFLEWKVYSLPGKRLGTIGAIMIVLGFIVQSIQYWINLFDIHLK